MEIIDVTSFDACRGIQRGGQERIYVYNLAW